MFSPVFVTAYTTLSNVWEFWCGPTWHYQWMSILPHHFISCKFFYCDTSCKKSKLPYLKHLDEVLIGSVFVKKKFFLKLSHLWQLCWWRHTKRMESDFFDISGTSPNFSWILSNCQCWQKNCTSLLIDYQKPM